MSFTIPEPMIVWSYLCSHLNGTLTLLVLFCSNIRTQKHFGILFHIAHNEAMNAICRTTKHPSYT